MKKLLIFLMKIHLKLKIKFRKKGNISESNAVELFMQEYNITDLKSFSDNYYKWMSEDENNRYIWDYLWGIIDIQQDQQRTIERGGGDCDDHSRLVQVILHKLGYKQYQQQYLQDPVTRSHGTCVFIDDNNKWRFQDYYVISKNSYDSVLSQVEQVANRYISRLTKSYFFDIKWNMLEDKDIEIK